MQITNCIKFFKFINKDRSCINYIVWTISILVNSPISVQLNVPIGMYIRGKYGGERDLVGRKVSGRWKSSVYLIS